VRIGAHLSIAKGLNKAADTAVVIGANTFQFFTRNPRGGKARKIPDTEMENWKHKRECLNLFPVNGHVPYTVNMATPKQDLWEFAVRVLREDLDRCDRIGAEYLVVHPGSHLGKGEQYGVDRIAEAINRAMDGYDGSTLLLLETMAGQGTEVGYSFEVLAQILEKVEDSRIGICFDSCHLFAAGYRVDRTESLKKVLLKFDEVIGTGHLHLVHLNDSAFDLGSRKDRHAGLGEGILGERGIRAFLNNDILRKLPYILETPVDTYEDYAPQIAAARCWSK